MARLTGPLFSLAASGTIAETLTFASWKGISYVRTRVVPANPQSVRQVAIRNIFKTLNDLWKRMPTWGRRPFLYDVRGRPLTDRNRHVQANVAVLQDESDLDNLVMSVSNGMSVPPLNVVTADGADGTITITADAPSLPAGYTLQRMIALAVLDGDPEEPIVRSMYDNQDDAAPYSWAVDVPTDDTYQVGVFCVFDRTSDARVFTSASERSQVVVTGN